MKHNRKVISFFVGEGISTIFSPPFYPLIFLSLSNTSCCLCFPLFFSVYVIRDVGLGIYRLNTASPA